jgi:AraC-like DNA-binding protein
MLEARAKRDPAALRVLVEVANESGMSAPRLLSGTNLTADQLDKSDLEIEAWQELLAIRNLRLFNDDVGLGLEVGRRLHITTLGVLGFAMLSSRSIVDALWMASRFQSISLWFCKLDFDLDAKVGVFTVLDHVLPMACRPFCVARGLSSLQEWMSAMLGREILPLSTTFKFDRPASAAPFERHFGTNILYGAKANRIEFEASLFVEPLRFADHWTRTWCELQLEQEAQRRASTTRNRVRSLIMGAPGAIRSEEEIARELRVPSSTLRRRLRAEGTTFRTIRAEVLHAFAREMLISTSMTIDEIAERVGFSESASFVRSFKRLQGVAPGTWRRSERGNSTN